MTGVIRRVSSRPVGRNRLVLQDVCRPDGLRCMEAVHEQQGDDGEWRVVMIGDKPLTPAFQPRFWVDAIGNAAAAGMLGGKDYKRLMILLTQGLDGSRTPPQAYIRVEGALTVEFDTELYAAARVDEVKIYRALERQGSEVTASHVGGTGSSRTLIKYDTIKELHYDTIVSRFREELAAEAGRTSLEDIFSRRAADAFCDIFGDPGLEAAGFLDEESYEATYAITVR